MAAQYRHMMAGNTALNRWAATGTFSAILLWKTVSRPLVSLRLGDGPSMRKLRNSGAEYLHVNAALTRSEGVRGVGHELVEGEHAQSGRDC